MTRPLRIEYPGALYFITSSGNAGAKIFLDIKDKQYFIGLLREIFARYKWSCYAYCLMDDHYQLLVETLEANLSSGMRQLNGIYTQKFNRVHKKTGHVFGGRFKAVLVDKDSYFLQLCAHIVLSPIRAKIINGPMDWKWSSYRATIGKEVDNLVEADHVLMHFGKNKSDAISRYIEFVSDSRYERSPAKDIKGQILMGPDNFVLRHKPFLAKKQTAGEITGIQKFAARPGLDDIFSNGGIRKAARNKKVIEAHMKYGYRLNEIAAKLGVHYTTVSKIINQGQVLKY